MPCSANYSTRIQKHQTLSLANNVQFSPNLGHYVQYSHKLKRANSATMNSMSHESGWQWTACQAKCLTHGHQCGLWELTQAPLGYVIITSYLYTETLGVLSEIFSMRRVNHDGVVEALNIYVHGPASINSPPSYHTVVGVPRYDDVAGVTPPPNYTTAVRERDARLAAELTLQQATDAVDI